MIVWAIFIAGTLGLMAFHAGDWNWAGVWESRYFLLGGLGVSLGCAIASLLAGLIVGTGLAVLRVHGPRQLAAFGGLVVNFIQALPPLVLLLAIYFVVPEATGIRLSGLVAGLIGMSLVSSAYLAEVVRAGLASVPPVQWESGRTTGLRDWEVFVFVVLPQAVRNMIPAFLTIAVIIFKSTTLLYPLGVVDFFRAAALVNNRLIEPGLVYSLVAIVYFVACLLMSWVAAALEPKTGCGLRQMG